jgi:hypothetical protein
MNEESVAKNTARRNKRNERRRSSEQHDNRVRKREKKKKALYEYIDERCDICKMISPSLFLHFDR